MKTLNSILFYCAIPFNLQDFMVRIKNLLQLKKFLAISIRDMFGNTIGNWWNYEPYNTISKLQISMYVIIQNEKVAINIQINQKLKQYVQLKRKIHKHAFSVTVYQFKQWIRCKLKAYCN